MVFIEVKQTTIQLSVNPKQLQTKSELECKSNCGLLEYEKAIDLGF
jgi:hypothetical protein